MADFPEASTAERDPGDLVTAARDADGGDKSGHECYSLARTLAGWMQAKNVDEAEFGQRSGLTVATLHGILDGHVRIGPARAQALQRGTGISAAKWLKLQAHDEQCPARLESYRPEHIESEVDRLADEQTLKTVVRRLVVERQRQGISRERMAAHLGVPPARIAKLEGYRDVRASELMRYARVLGLRIRFTVLPAEEQPPPGGERPVEPEAPDDAGPRFALGA